MIGKIILGKNEEYKHFNYNIMLHGGEIDYSITINTDLSTDFETLIYHPTDFEASIDSDIDFYAFGEPENSKETIELLEKAKENQVKYLEACEYIEFDFENEEVLEYLKKNPNLRTKKIVLRQKLDLNNQPVQQIKQLFSEYTNNLYFMLPGNSNYISYKEYEDTMTTLDIMAEEINKFDFSSIEKIMYVYDMIRNRIYKKEDTNENSNISRDLSSSLLGEKIVCLGYARIFKALLEKIGIQCNEVFLDGKKTSHARCEIYVKDDKYQIDGVYYFDPTWDSKKNEGDNTYLLSYRFFAKTRKEMDKIDNNEYISRAFPYYSTNMDIEFEDAFNEGGIKNIPKDLVKSINYMSRLINQKNLLEPMSLIPISPNYGKIDKDKVYIELTDLIEFFEKPLRAETLLKVLYNVRKQQYYQDPIKYPFCVNDFYKTVTVSAWHFEPSPNQRLLNFILGEDIKETPKKKMTSYITESHIDKDIEQIKLTKTLKKILEHKINN